MSERGNSSARGKAAKKTEMAERRALVTKLALDRMSLREIQTALENQRGIKVGLSTLSRDLIDARARWREQERVQIAQAQDQELARLAEDEKRLRAFMATLPADAHEERCAYQDRILKIMQHRAKILGTEAPQKIEQKIDGRVAFTDDVSKILADPEATTKLLDAVQGQTITLPVAAPAPLPANGMNGTQHP